MTNPLDQLKARVDAAVALLDAATPGPWSWDETAAYIGKETLRFENECLVDGSCDTAFIAASPSHVTLIQDLWALVQAQQGEIERLHRDDTFGRMVEAAMKEVVPRSQEADDFTAAGKQGGYLK